MRHEPPSTISRLGYPSLSVARRRMRGRPRAHTCLREGPHCENASAAEAVRFRSPLRLHAVRAPRESRVCSVEGLRRARPHSKTAAKLKTVMILGEDATRLRPSTEHACREALQPRWIRAFSVWLVVLVPLGLLACTAEEEGAGSSVPLDEAAASAVGDTSGVSTAPPAELPPAQVAAGVVRVTVNASSNDVWVYLDLDTGAVVEATDSTWDLAFQRFKVLSNGGVSGSGGVEVLPVSGADFAALAQAPAGDYLEDRTITLEDLEGEAAQFSAGDVESAFLGATAWYDYNASTHVLSPAPFVYVVRSTEGAYFKVRFDDYYNAAGSPANITLAFGPIDPPPANPEAN